MQPFPSIPVGGRAGWAHRSATRQIPGEGEGLISSSPSIPPLGMLRRISGLWRNNCLDSDSKECVHRAEPAKKREKEVEKAWRSPLVKAYPEMQTDFLPLSSCVSSLCMYQRVCSHLTIYVSVFLLMQMMDQSLILWASCNMVFVVVRVHRSAVLAVILYDRRKFCKVVIDFGRLPNMTGTNKQASQA